MESSGDTKAAIPEAPVAVFKKRGAKGKANLRKRPATPPPQNDSDDESGYTSSEDEAGRRVKRRRRDAAIVTASSRDAARQRDGAALSATVFAADRSVGITSVNDSTKASNWYDEGGELSERNLLGAAARGKAGGGGGGEGAADGLYRGMANKTKFIQRDENAPNRTVGPIKAPTNIRTVTTMDFAPDVCKDYKQTGFCGFGDNCKFLHDRSDVMQGWQMDKEWEKVSKGKKTMSGTVVASANRGGGRGKDDDDDDEGEEALLEKIPFKCIICKGDYRQPVVTRCGHYFCEGCALKRYRKDPGCAACGAGTNGVFNSAGRLERLLARKRERAERARLARVEAGEEVDGEGEGGKK